jgi:CheY-like chemotaxis protein
VGIGGGFFGEVLLRRITGVGPIAYRQTGCSGIKIPTCQRPAIIFLYEEGVVMMAKDNHRTAPPVRVLVVEDFQPFRRVICAMLGTMPGLQVIDEVSDGLEAVRKAAELQPDLILLDVGLPTLNGIAAARQIRIVAPQSSIIFVTQESDRELVREGLSLGTRGWVVKTMVARDLLTAVDAALDGRQFVSGGLTAHKFTTQATITSMN